MKNLPPCATQTRPRVQLGYIEEYYASQSFSSFGCYLGHRAVAELAQSLGTEGRRIITLAEPTVLQRSWSKQATLKAGSIVCRVVWPLEGREIN